MNRKTAIEKLDGDFRRLLPGVLSEELSAEVCASARMPDGTSAIDNGWIRGSDPRGALKSRGAAYRKELAQQTSEDLDSHRDLVDFMMTTEDSTRGNVRCPRVLRTDNSGGMVICVGQPGHQPCLEKPLASFPCDGELGRVYFARPLYRPPHLYRQSELILKLRTLLLALCTPQSIEEDKARVQSAITTGGTRGCMCRMHMASSRVRTDYLLAHNCIVFELELGANRFNASDSDLIHVSSCTIPAYAERIVHIYKDCFWDSEVDTRLNEHSYRVSLRAAMHESVSVFFQEEPDIVPGAWRIGGTHFRKRDDTFVIEDGD